MSAHDLLELIGSVLTIGAVFAGYGRAMQKIKDLIKNQAEDRQSMNEIAKLLSAHIRDDSSHINGRAWDLMIDRLNRIENAQLVIMGRLDGFTRK